MASIGYRRGGTKKRAGSGVEIARQFYIARQYFHRLPSEIAEVSSLEWNRLEAILEEEARTASEEARKVERQQRLRDM